MITFLGITMSYEVAILLASFLISEVLPFLPNKYNGLAQSLVELLGKVKLRKAPDQRIEILLDRLEDLENKLDKK